VAHSHIGILLAGLLLAQTRPAPPIPKYEVKRAGSPIVVDGKIDDKAWAAAGAAQLTFPWESQTGAKQQTVARLLWDDDNLYVSYECEDADITSNFTQRDDPTYRDDAVEIFINPRPTQQTTAYIGLEMNARGVLYDYLSVGLNPKSRLFFKRFNLDGVKVAAAVNGTLNERSDKDRGWSLEVSIPWVNFEEFSKRPSPGTAWSFNLNRWDGVEPNRRMSIWSDSMLERPGPHAPERFGEMLFVE
jgi:hypothetical protein